nr:putative GH32 family protein [Oppiella nova]
MNDPNGLVFHEGRYHLFYQCNPEGWRHAHLSWGHASSADLVQWEHHAVAIRDDEDGEIYSGSTVIDVHNSSGLGTADAAPLVAVYTQASPRRQRQSIASSVDGGRTWRKYDGNPVLDRGTSDFRDPKVFRYTGAAGSYWVMVAVEAQDRQVLLHRSDDLVDWEFLSSFGPEGAVGGVWECPDLFPLAVDGDADDVRWVLLISLNPGGIAGGSGTQYVIGDFDGVRFVPDPDPTDHEVDWLDFGRDCYAGVTFDGLAQEHRTLIAWMSNWDYSNGMQGGEGSLGWGMMTLPRTLSLVRLGDRIRLRQIPVPPALAAASTVTSTVITEPARIGALPEGGCVRLRVDVDNAAGFALRLRADETGNGGVELAYDREDGVVTLDRRNGADALPTGFGSVQRMPVERGAVVEWEIWLDRASIELFADAGTRTLTDLIPEQQGDQFWIEGRGGAVRIERLEIAAVTGR